MTEAWIPPEPSNLCLGTFTLSLLTAKNKTKKQYFDIWIACLPQNMFHFVQSCAIPIKNPWEQEHAMICTSNVLMHFGMGAVFLNIYEGGVKGPCLANTLRI